MGEKVRSLLDMETPLSAWGETDIKLLAQPQGDMSNLALADFWGYKDVKQGVSGQRQNRSAPLGKCRIIGIRFAYDVYMNNNAWWANVPPALGSFASAVFNPPKNGYPTAPKKS